MELGVASFDSSLDQALTLGGRALALAETSRRAAIVSAIFEANALVLGALQREASVRELHPHGFSSAAVVRRLTTGTEAALKGAVLYHALALPKVDALYPDASSRTLLNRNLRALLRGYAAAGLPLRYFGTEVLALLGRPVALVGYDQAASGAVLIEVLLGLEHACVVRSALKREAPAALFVVSGARPAPRELLERVVEGVVARLDATRVDVSAQLADAGLAAPPFREIGDTGEVARVTVPIGVVEASIGPKPRIFGDILASRSALAEVERLAATSYALGSEPSAALLAPLERQPLDGARAGDILEALSRAAACARQRR